MTSSLEKFHVLAASAVRGRAVPLLNSTLRDASILYKIHKTCRSAALAAGAPASSRTCGGQPTKSAKLHLRNRVACSAMADGSGPGQTEGGRGAANDCRCESHRLR